MTAFSNYSMTGQLRRLRANWLALFLPLVAAGTLHLFGSPIPELLIALAAVFAVTAAAYAAKLAPYAVLAYGAYGTVELHTVQYRYWWGRADAMRYGMLDVVPGRAAMWLVLPEALVIMAAGAVLLAWSTAPGAAAVRRAAAQLRGTGGQPRTVPPLLLLPVLFVWEELFTMQWWLLVAILAAGAVVVLLLPRVAAAAAVAGLAVLGLGGVLKAVSWLWIKGMIYPAITYGAVLVNGTGKAALLACAQGGALLWCGCALAPRLLSWGGDAELTRLAQALAQRVDRLTRTRSDATEVAVAELRRIERDLHDGAQARLVAVGMSLRGAETLFASNPEAALALIAEARQTSSRALADLRDLVRGMYPPLLADRGLADAIRALALDTPLDVDVVDVDLSGEPTMPVAAAVYFGVAEALTNAVRHAEARRAQVSVRHSAGMLRASVSDDGHGGADPSRGTGLAGVERRLATFDGILSVTSPAGGPTIVAIEVPCALSSVKTSFS